MAGVARTVLASAALLALLLSVDAAAFGSPAAHSPAAVTSGQGGEYSWEVSATRGASGPQRSRPCLQISITHHHGDFSYDRSKFRGCVIAPASLSGSAAPLLVGGTHLGNPGDPSMSVFAVLASPTARRVRISSEDLSDGGSLTAPLLPVPQTPGGLGDLRLALIAVPGVHCIERVAVEGAGHAARWASFPQEDDCG